MKIDRGVSELWRVENLPLPLTWPMAYTTACTTAQAVILYVTYFLTSLTMPDLQSSDMCHIRSMMSSLPLASARFSKLWIPFISHLLDGDLCKKIIFIFSLLLCFSIMILSYTLILSTSQLQTQQPVTSQIRSHTEYLTQTYNILVLILY